MSIFNVLDARTKLLFVLLFTLLIFLVDKLPVAVCLLMSFILIRFVSKVSFNGLKLVKNLTLLVTFIVLMQMLFGPGESYIIKPFKWEGFIFGLMISCRLAALMIILPVFTETTPPHKIAAGLCALGFNYRASFIITTAFNLIPFFKEEALVIMDAQKLRGMRVFERQMHGIRGMRAFTGLLVPLMLGAMRKAQAASVAMDSRSFGIYKTRTWIDKPKMKICDFWFIAGCIVFFALFLVLNYYDWTLIIGEIKWVL